MSYLLTLLKSKRLWVMLVTFLLHSLVAHYGLKLTSADATAMATDIVLAGGASAIVATKLMDATRIVGVLTDVRTDVREK